MLNEETRKFNPTQLTLLVKSALQDAIESCEQLCPVLKSRIDEYKELVKKIDTNQLDVRLSPRDY